MQQISRKCPTCGRKTLHSKPTMSGGMGCLLVILTGGLFLPLWLLYAVLIVPLRPYRCQSCGRSRLI